jgi:hypothetical protein
MVASKQATVSERRALLTDREREIIAGDADVADSYRYQTISRVRARFDRLEGDLQALEEHGELADEFRGIVCRTGADQSPPAGAREIAAEGAGVSGEESAGGGSTPQPPGDGESRSESAHGGESAGGEHGDVERAIAALDTTDERRGAVRACVDHLREHGTAQRKDFLAALYPEHAAGFGSEGGWWNRIGKEYLNAVADRVDAVEAPPKEGSRTWRYPPAIDDGEGEGDE